MRTDHLTTPEKIQQAALELFVQNGIENTSTKSITERAGFATGTLFKYFVTKQQLIDNLYMDIKRPVINQILDKVDEMKGYQRNVLDISKCMIQYMCNNPLYMPFLKDAKSGSGASESVIVAVENELSPIGGYLCQGIEEGVVKNMPAPMLSALMMGVVEVMVEFVCAGEDVRIDDQLVMPVWDMIKA